MRSTDNTAVLLREGMASKRGAIRAWIHPGASWGQEFVYAKSRAAELAKITNEPVLATPIELAAAPIEALKTAPVEAVKPTGEEVELAQVVEPPPVAAAEPQPAAAETLPKTASLLPLIGLIGLLSLGVSFVFWIVSKRTV